MTAAATTSSGGAGQLVHAALLYRDPRQLRLAVDGFVCDAARVGEPVLAVLPADQLESLGDVLDAPGIERRDMMRVGRNPARLIALFEDWLSDHVQSGVRARIVSESLYPGRSTPEAAECLRHEALVNLALAARPVSVLCAYDAGHLDAPLLRGAERTHPHLIDVAGSRASLLYGDPAEVGQGRDWPQPPPPMDADDLHFDGDLAALRRALHAAPQLAGLDPERRGDYVFAINEVATNALYHGDGAADARMWRDGDRIVTEVTSASQVPGPLAGRRRPAVDAPGGRGLYLVNQLCDLVELRNAPRGCSVRMHIDG